MIQLSYKNREKTLYFSFSLSTLFREYIVLRNNLQEATIQNCPQNQKQERYQILSRCFSCRWVVSNRMFRHHFIFASRLKFCVMRIFLKQQQLDRDNFSSSCLNMPNEAKLFSVGSNYKKHIIFTTMEA